MSRNNLRPGSPANRARSAWRRSFFTSTTVHVAVLGAGALFGLLTSAGRTPVVRAYSAVYLPPVELPFALAETEVREVVQPPEPSEPELRESELWSAARMDFIPEPPRPEPVRAADWMVSRPFAIGTLVAREPTLAQATRPEPVPEAVSSMPAAEPLPAAVVDPVPLAVPAPPYPRLSRRAGEEGSVLCRLELDLEGRVVAVDVLESSGFARLDRAAREALVDWRFEPRREDGQAVRASVLHRVTFRLSES